MTTSFFDTVRDKMPSRRERTTSGRRKLWATLGVLTAWSALTVDSLPYNDKLWDFPVVEVASPFNIVGSLVSAIQGEEDEHKPAAAVSSTTAASGPGTTLAASQPTLPGAIGSETTVPVVGPVSVAPQTSQETLPAAVTAPMNPNTSAVITPGNSASGMFCADAVQVTIQPVASGNRAGKPEYWLNAMARSAGEPLDQIVDTTATALWTDTQNILNPGVQFPAEPQIGFTFTGPDACDTATYQLIAG